MRVALSRTVLPVRAAPFHIRHARQPQPAVFHVVRRPACRIGMRRQAALRVISPLLAAAVRINDLLYLAIFGVTVLPFLVIHFPVNQVAFAVIAVCRRGAVVPVSRYLPERIPLPFTFTPVLVRLTQDSPGVIAFYLRFLTAGLTDTQQVIIFIPFPFRDAPQRVSLFYQQPCFIKPQRGDGSGCIGVLGFALCREVTEGIVIQPLFGARRHHPPFIVVAQVEMRRAVVAPGIQPALFGTRATAFPSKVTLGEPS